MNKWYKDIDMHMCVLIMFSNVSTANRTKIFKKNFKENSGIFSYLCMAFLHLHGTNFFFSCFVCNKSIHCHVCPVINNF